MMEKIHWQISVPIFKNTVIMKQLGLAIGIPFGLVALVIGFASGKSVYVLYGLGLIGALLFFTWLFIMAVYRGSYETEFVLDDKGALCRTQAKQANKNRIVNALTVVLGLLSGKPAAALSEKVRPPSSPIFGARAASARMASRGAIPTISVTHLPYPMGKRLTDLQRRSEIRSI